MQETPAKTATLVTKFAFPGSCHLVTCFPPLKTTPKHECSRLGRGVCGGEDIPVNIPLRVHSDLATANILHSFTSTETYLDESWNIQALSVPLLEIVPTAFEAKKDTY